MALMTAWMWGQLIGRIDGVAQHGAGSDSQRPAIARGTVAALDA